MRRIKFRPSLRSTMLANAAWMAAQSKDGALPADLQRSLDASLPKAPRPRALRDGVVGRYEGVDIDRIHRRKPQPPLEADVIRTVIELLDVHPKVIFCVRQNSGSASYQTKAGTYAPVNFYRIIRAPEAMTIPDIWGFLRGGRYFALEAKREGWRAPKDDRERRQAAFLAMVRQCGGVGAFVRNADEAQAAIEA